MNILAIANNKGGVGKTTSTQNIGAAIGTFTNSSVLLIDLDPQASLSKSFGIYLDPKSAHVGSFLLGRTNLASTIHTYKESKIDLLPSSIALIGDEEDLKKHPTFPFNLLKALEASTDKKQYDFIVIDCPPALSTLTTIALVACERYYVPLQAEYFSYEGLRDFIHYANQIVSINNRIQLGGVFANRFNPHSKKNFSKNLILAIEEQLGDSFLKSYIRDNIALSEAQAKGQHIFDYDQKSRGAQDYYNLTKEIIATK
jgi:chromosome partitioning protein